MRKNGDRRRRAGSASRRCALAALVAVSALPAQEARSRQLAGRFEATEPGSQAWCELGCELLEAQWVFDVRLAKRTASGMWEVAAKSEVVGVAATMAATMARIVVMGEGPAYAKEWLARAVELPEPVAPALRVHYFGCRARTSCACNNHVDEVAYAAQAQAAAQATQDPIHRLRAAALNGHATSQREAVKIRRLFADGEAAGRAGDLEHLRPNLYFEERRAAVARGDQAGVAKAEARLAEHAARTGDLRVLGDLRLFEGVRLAQAGQSDEAVVRFREVVELMAKVGDVRGQSGGMRAQAHAALASGDLGIAEELLDDCDRFLAGRGMAYEEREVLGLRAELAMRQRDSARASSLQEQLARLDEEADEIARRAAEAHEQAHQAEAEREDAEVRLTAELASAANAAQLARTIGGLGIVVALSVVAAVTWRSRRRLVAANTRLAEQVLAVEQARVAQAQLEERMRQLERTETLGTMAAGVAHDFNNLLTSILGNAELLARATVGDDRELAQTILRAGEQASRLCRQLQAYSGGTPTRHMPLELVAMAREMLPSLHAALRGQVDVQLQAGDAAIVVMADRGQMEQVLLNLVVNARDARASHIRIQIGQRPDENTVDAALATLAVIDDGDGMTTEVQQRIFDPFFTTRFPGRGLGLAVVHGVVRRHAGKIHVRSAPGNGSQFTIELPCAATNESPVVIPSPPVEPNHLPPDVAVIAVDDDASVRMLLARFFDRLSAHAMVVENGPAAIDAVAGIVPHRRVVAFVDLTMPEMDGVEVVRRLRELRPDLRVVVMSGHPPAYVEQVARGLAADHVLAKPFTIDAVRALLATLAREVAPGQPVRGVQA